MSKSEPAARERSAGLAHYRRGEFDRAEARFREAVALDPHDDEGHNCLGIAVAARGRVAEAADHFRAALSCNPRSLAAATNLAEAALNLDRFEDARAALATALEIAPGEPGLHAMQAEALASTGRLAEALASASRWAELAPRDAAAHRARGQLAVALGEYPAALGAYRSARSLEAGNPEDLRGLADCLELARFERHDPAAERELLECLQTGDIESQRLARAAGDLLSIRYARGDDPTPGGDALAGSEARGLPRDPLLLALLEHALNVDARLERLLAAQRRALLLAVAANGALPGPWRRFAAAIATQCCLNEHVWPVTAEERAQAARLAARLAETTPPAGEDPARLADLVVAVGMYVPLVSLANAAVLAAALDWPAERGPLLRLALAEPLQERELAAAIPRAPIRDGVSVDVRSQYEESPYPRWVNLPPPNPEPVAYRLAHDFPAFTPARVLDPPVRVLIAGGGTGRHSLRVARRDPSAQVIAIDLSIASLAYALRRARELGIANIELRQLDILDAGTLDGQFGIVESTGVLHHMQDPAAGLAALAGKLASGGVMKLGLYSRRARRLVTLARERIAAEGRGATADEMREFRAGILDGAYPELAELEGSSDLYAMSTCRDLLFHVQEHQFSPLDLAHLVESAGLRFLGFQLPGSRTRERYRERFPEDEGLTDLASWDAFEQEFPGTFANLFQFWCQKPG